jgi:hypothetical protein
MPDGTPSLGPGDVFGEIAALATPTERLLRSDQTDLPRITSLD